MILLGSIPNLSLEHGWPQPNKAGSQRCPRLEAESLSLAVSLGSSTTSRLHNHGISRTVQQNFADNSAKNLRWTLKIFDVILQNYDWNMVDDSRKMYFFDLVGLNNVGIRWLRLELSTEDFSNVGVRRPTMEQPSSRSWQRRISMITAGITNRRFFQCWCAQTNDGTTI